MAPKEKYCKGCKVTKPIKLFTRNSDGKDGYRNYCKACQGVQRINKGRPRKSNSAFFSSEVFELMKHHRYKEVARFEVFFGILIFIRPRDIMAFSVVTWNKKGSQVFEKENEARAWLYKQMVEAGIRTEVGLSKMFRRLLK